MFGLRDPAPARRRSGATRQKGAMVSAPRRDLPKPQQQQQRVMLPADRGAYHLSPINPSVSTSTAAGTPRHSAAPVASELPLTVVPSTHTRALVSSRALAGPVQMWPAVQSSRQKRHHGPLESKAPLSLQLEGFIRREHQQYIEEHPSCSRTDTLYIFKEALSTFVNHFSEYKGVLYLIRDEYDAALSEMTEKVKQMQVEYLESQSDRGLHAMELMQLKESMNATISNQQAQLSVTQGLVHALRDQLTAAEHANSLLTLEMDLKKKTYMEAQQQVKMLSRAMIEESARTAAARERMSKMEKENELQEARIKVLKENVTELEECLREQAYAQVGVASAANGAGHFQSPLSSSGEGGDAAANDRHVKEYIAHLLHRVDALEMQVQTLTKGTLTEPPTTTLAAARKPPPPQKEEGGGSVASVKAADALFPVIREWIRMEGIGEAEVEATDVIVPPGHWPAEDMSFLSVVRPVKHRHLSLAVTLRLLESMWSAREHSTSASASLQQFFLEWLRTESGDVAEAKALGVNILDTCQHNLQHPECRTLLLVLRGFLPEELVHVCRRRLTQLERAAQSSPTTMLGRMPFEDFFAIVRAVCPEKSVANMLQLRFTLFHQCADAKPQVELGKTLDGDSYFVTLFKLQWTQEVETFTLRVVEGIRAVSDEKHNAVSINRSVAVLHALDPALRDEDVHGYLHLASQKPVIDIASAVDGATVHLDTLLTRFRTSVLLLRRSPEDAVG